MHEQDQHSVLRILDVNLNRVAEALRAVEEVCRFHWNAKGLASDLKSLRHEVLGAVAPTAMRRAALFEARDIAGDVGRGTPSPSGGSEPDEMAIRNLQRAKESLRALEEASRVAGISSAEQLEAARYSLYAIEKALGRFVVSGTDRQHLLRRVLESRLCLLATASLSLRPLQEVVHEAIEAGAGMVQLREKGVNDRTLLKEARMLRDLTARWGALFIVNDRPDIAILAEADGVHLGQTDLRPTEARRIVGKGRLVGVSTHSLDEARGAERDGADYIGLGPLFQTSTKDAGPIFGPERLREVLEKVSIPAFAIGGINADRASLIRESGCGRVAVSSAVLCSQDPGGSVRDIIQALTTARHK